MKKQKTPAENCKRYKSTSLIRCLFLKPFPGLKNRSVLYSSVTFVTSMCSAEKDGTISAALYIFGNLPRSVT
ncbi:hypothetical protein ASU31_26725 [Pedobacter ginsenosidimutans]|uniref:Uncharacterized protein n=1 Tax=Pedobacter ginsenosidimutans TaxID=687842 RepID=A0A0T5VGQ3_9SPHI|nr:hypothetical protein ASU31_26725 [Pedobacter ginsenosidimutans]